MDSSIGITVNGEAREMPAASTVSSLLAELAPGARIAVERNGEIVPRSLHATTPLAAGDRVEIVIAVGGG